MKRFLLSLLVTLIAASANAAELPKTIFSGLQGKHHVQGIVVNPEKGYVCFSFTTRLIKLDLQGNLIGSVDGFTGHLGCLAYNDEDGRIYGSIEYKNDKIGVGIYGDAAKNRENAFYIAIFDPDKITRPNMAPTDDNVMSTVYLKDVADDYYAFTENQGKKVEHRFGCSGIDGVAFAPRPGKPDSKKIFYVAYGIYADTARTDNDYQVLLAYDTRNWKKYERPPLQDKLHHSGPSKPMERYYVYTGNTSWGIQNLNYDSATNCLIAAVYKGIKPTFPNYSLFAIDLNKKPVSEALKGFDNKIKGKVLSLKEEGQLDKATGVRGWHFKYGATGICSLGDGLFYISHNSKKPEQNSTLHLYRWTGDADNAFVKVK